MDLFQKLGKEELNGLFIILEEAFSRFDIDFYIIGALARDIILKGKYDITVPRATVDVDIAVLIPHYDIFNQLKEYLCGNGFKQDEINGYRLFFNPKIIIDLLPFGEIENSENRVKIYGKEIHELFVLGLNELKETAEKIEYAENKSFMVTTLPSLCILKLISWNDERAERIKDIEDFTFILSKYSEIYQDDIYNNHYDILGNGWNPDIISPRILGRDIGEKLKLLLKTKEVISNIISEEMKDVHTSKLSELMSSFNRKTIEENLNMLSELLKGINEKL